jgi:DNA-binding NarL/FixJ family response regulator
MTWPASSALRSDTESQARSDPAHVFTAAFLEARTAQISRQTSVALPAIVPTVRSRAVITAAELMSPFEGIPVGRPNVIAGRGRDREPATSRVVSLLIAEEHGVVRDGLRLILEAAPDVQVVATVGDGADAVRQAERLKPDIAIIGVLMPGLNGIDATRRLVQKNPRIGVVVLSMQAGLSVARRAFEAGALGVLTKTSDRDEVLRAVRAVASGERFVSHGIGGTLLESATALRRGERPVATLTSAELNILRLVADGRTNPQVAASLGLSPRTVETYRQRLMRKLDLGSVAALVKYAIRNGIVALD